MAPWIIILMALWPLTLIGLAPKAYALPLGLYHDLLKREEPPKALGSHSEADYLRWQPSLDFDTDSCYNVPAIDTNGNLAQGLPVRNTCNECDCREMSDLDNNNVYVRKRCNHGWCVYLYDYYFEKDVAGGGKGDGGHRHEWEHIAVFVDVGSQGDTPRLDMVAASRHGGYETRVAGDVRMDRTHPKIVYHKEREGTHCFRFATEEDERIENHARRWFRGDVVAYDMWPSRQLRDKLMTYEWEGPATMAINDVNFKKDIEVARNGGAPGFDSNVDQ
ncbi:necrosis inducing protein-domain-containing protein [Pseudomassariella vexata]|uniref:Necrosis inducing protein-domain-containing protein n=1 Tax=Pseudomassariella vexata TaxID=1141098 RepID=A0A1Y2DBJ5_9PEZI|nr:necrosis inducing protein-domain-containing protein [Pseudomassariella vexata]ORY56639.1 necrosis inducing protein-domain-containing protein [Pseudomassariella vexata]